jgi:nucleoside-diphosphate-sugar epimerase
MVRRGPTVTRMKERILVLGATGALGRPLCARLRSAGHDVYGTHRSPDGARVLEGLGCVPLAFDVFDEQAAARAIDDARPQVIVHQLTALPKQPSPRAMARGVAATSELRKRTVPVFAGHARRLGARLLVQSISFVTRPEGPAVQDESAPLWLDAPAAVASAIDAVRVLEEATVGSGGLVLRYGFLYGPGTWYAADGAIAALVRKRMLPIVGKGGGLSSFVHVDDAVDATVAAIERGEGGIYNVCDDEPVAQSVWLPEIARLLRAKPPRRVPAWVVGVLVGAGPVYYGASLRGASNAKAKAAWAWAPRPWRAGFEAVFAQ